MSNAKCIGCGATLQTVDENVPGFIPKSGMDNENAICKRCFRLKNYNEVMDINVNSGDYLTMLNALYEADGLIVKVVDIFDFDSSIIPSFNRIVGDKNVIVVLNKMDILPKSVNIGRLIHQVKFLLSKEGIKLVDAVAISAKKNHGIDQLLKTINRYRTNEDVYVVGTTNVGKSTLINRLIENTSGEKEIITTSRFPGTTLDLIDIPLGDGSFIFDTPGIVVESQMTRNVAPEDLKYIMPTKELKPKTFQLSAGQTLFLGPLAAVSYVDGHENSLTVYVSDKITIHRTKYENHESFYDNHFNGLLAPPTLEVPVLDHSRVKTFEVEGGTDVLISGLGFIAIRDSATIEVKVPEHVEVYTRPSMFKGMN